MKKKQVVGILIAILGVILVSYAFRSSEEVDSSRRNTAMITGPFSGAGNLIQKSVDAKLDNYDMKIRYLFVGGSVLIVIGGILIFVFRKR